MILTVLSAACSSRQTTPPAGTAQPDRFLFERGTEALKKEEWVNARTYFQQIVDGYPQSPFRPDAKLGVGDAYLGEGTTESCVLAANEFREFLTFYPTNPRADYAQYKLAMSHFRQMRAPERDQTETKAALAEFDVFFQKFPNSALTSEVKQNWRDCARSPERGVVSRRLCTTTAFAGIPARSTASAKSFATTRRSPVETRVYFYLAESLARTDKTAEAIPYFERLLTEFDQQRAPRGCKGEASGVKESITYRWPMTVMTARNAVALCHAAAAVVAASCCLLLHSARPAPALNGPLPRGPDARLRPNPRLCHAPATPAADHGRARNPSSTRASRPAT